MNVIHDLVIAVLIPGLVGSLIGWFAYRRGYRKGWRACNDALLEEARRARRFNTRIRVQERQQASINHKDET